MSIAVGNGDRLAPPDRRRFSAAGALIALVAAAGLVRESLRLVVVLILVVAPVTAAWPALVHRGWRRAAAVAGSGLHPIKAPAGASITAFPGPPRITAVSRTGVLGVDTGPS
jgi:hypothetical protein